MLRFKPFATILLIIIFTLNSKSLPTNYQKTLIPQQYLFDQEDNTIQKKISILLFTTFWGMGSVEVYNWNIQRLMAQTAFNHDMVVCDQSELHKKMCTEKITHYCFSTSFGEKNFEEKIRNQLRALCIQKKINIVQTHTIDDTKRALHALKGLRTKVIFMFHQDYNQPITEIKNVSGILALNDEALNFMKEENRKKKLGIQHFKHLFLLPDRKKYINYQPPQVSRSEYFKTEYNINLTNAPIICMAAQFYGPEQHIPSKFRKNQALLIHAAAKLINEHKKPVHILFAGAGPSQAWHEALTKELGLENYVHFLGYCKSPEDIYFYSDFHVLTSIGEALGAVYMEAGLMKKASIGATKTGAEYLIAHQTTGLLFKNNDVNDLIEKIAFLIDNPEECKNMGECAYKLFTGQKTYGKTNRTFLDRIQVQELLQFYRQVMQK